MRRHASTSRLLEAAALLIASISPAVLCAQDAERGVARISVIKGEVSVRRGDSGEWVAAALNAPVMVEDRVSTGQGSRAEVQFDSANFLRIGAHAEVRMAQVDPGRYHLQVAHGTVTFRVLRESHAQVEVDTPTVSLRPAHIGAYRVYVQEDGQTEITVRLGELEVYTPKGSEQLRAGQTMLARGNPSDPEFRIVPAIAADEWDQWNEQRDAELQNSSSSSHVPEDVYGTEDLDNHGQWVNDPSYGDVWAPAVGPDWAPYQNGRWVWEDYYGWTWVSYDPWGWAPFHYGRWFYSGPYGWCWYPGGFGRHYWSPGLVAFFGFGPGVGVGFGFGNIGWVALAPYEPLYAWWGHGFYAGFRNPAYFNHGVNITSVNITNIYRNARVTNGVASVAAADFHQGRFGNISRTTGAQIHEAGLVRGRLPVAPSAASLRYSNRAVANPPRSSENVRFFSHNAPAPVQRVPFSEQQHAMQQYSRQPATTAHSGAAGSVSSNGGWRSLSSPAASPGTSARTAAPAAAAPNSGWRPLNQPQPAAPRGWQRFGEPRPATVPRTYPGAWSVPRPPKSQPAGPGYRPYSPPSAAAQTRPQSIRVAPPVVRERPASSAPARSGGGGGGGSHPSGGGGGGSHHR